MQRRLVFAGLLAVAAFGCSGGSNEPCKSCPNLAGNWSLSYEAPDPVCAGAREPPTTLAITRVGSIVRATVEGEEFTGTAYDTFDFTLRGDYVADGGMTSHAEFRAKFTEGTGDGGVDRLRGTWSFTPVSSSCVETRALTGTRL